MKQKSRDRKPILSKQLFNSDMLATDTHNIHKLLPASEYVEKILSGVCGSLGVEYWEDHINDRLANAEADLLRANMYIPFYLEALKELRNRKKLTKKK